MQTDRQNKIINDTITNHQIGIYYQVKFPTNQDNDNLIDYAS